MAPDLPHASGGLRVIHHMAQVLDAAGVDAVVWHGGRGPLPKGLEFEAPVDRADRRVLAPGDLLVMPEAGGGRWSFLVGGLPVVMLVQGPDFIFFDAEFDRAVVGAYPGWPGAVAAVTVSSSLEALLNEVVPDGFPVHHVPVGIDTERFRPRTKRRTIALMPRRRAADLRSVVQVLRRRGSLDAWDLTLIDGMDGDGVARALGDAAIFLSGAEREGFGLPGAEAMAAGAAVVGFTGHGAAEYMGEGRARVIAESDVLAMADAVEEAMREFDEDRETFERKAAAARAFVQRSYGLEVTARRSVEVFAQLQAPGSPALVRDATEVEHYSAHGGPSSRAGRAVLSARTWAGARKRALRDRSS